LSGFNLEDSGDFSRGARTYIVYPELPRTSIAIDARLEEARGLALAIGLEVVQAKHYRVRSPKASILLGGGQVDEITSYIKDNEIELFIVDTNLTAIQQRNLETATGVKTIDRTGLILEIFGERAATAEGRLQVELAHLDYQSGRLVRSWTHLERQRGGFGFLGGPGETQIEADRRMIRDRMAKLRRELEEVKRTRGLHRARRERAPWPVIALVGYTNAGKSTLFNLLTHSDVVAQDMLFATLDPTMREIQLPGVDKAILSDTVGFVSDLPTQLVAAFRATLEEVISADIIVHVRDIAHEASEAQSRDVITLLSDLGVNTEDQEPKPMIEIWNKIDLLSQDRFDELSEIASRQSDVIMLSAQCGQGIEQLSALLSNTIAKGRETRTLTISNDNGAAIAWLHNKGNIKKNSNEGDQVTITVSLSQQNWGRFTKTFGFN
jgi:GTPase